LNDGHYAWQSCYSSAFVSSHALSIVALADSAGASSTNVHFAPDLSVFVQQRGFAQIYASFDINPDELAGLQITKYDGVDIWQYLNETLVPKQGVYQDPAQRLNALFASTKGFSGSLGRSSGNFIIGDDYTKDNFTLTYRDASGQERDLLVPWVATYQSRDRFSYTSGASL
jgi:hypothetical protein